MLRGNSPSRIDDKGRLKIPTAFRKNIEDHFGRDVFLTSLTGEYARIYPMPIWLEIEKKIAKIPSFNPTVSRFLNQINYHGATGAFDVQGRILIHPLLRRSADVTGDVVVLGKLDHLDVWNRERFEAKLVAEPITEEDQQFLSSVGL